MNQIAVESTKVTITQSKAARIVQYLKSSFDDIAISAPAFDEAIMRNNPVMFVCTHRSHADYFLLGIVAYQMGFTRMRFAAGNNLTGLPVIGPWLVSLGAFTVNRERTTSRSYVRDLCDSVSGILSKNSHVIVFPEGGRSYKGQMLECKHGMLGAAIMAQVADPIKPVYYIPVSISYEQLPELAYFKILTQAKKLRKNATNPLTKFWGNLLYFGADLLALANFIIKHRRKKTYGAVYVDFDRPYAVSELADISSNINNQARDPFLAHRRSMQIVSEAVHRKFIALYRLLPHHIIATLLDRNNYQTRAQILHAIPDLVARLQKAGRNTRSLENVSPETIMARGIKQLIAHGAIAEKKGAIRMRDKATCSYFAAACHGPAGKD